METLCVSFVKGVGKTTGGMLVVGIVTGLWLLTTSGQYSRRLKKQLRSRGTNTRDSRETRDQASDIVDVQMDDFKKVFEGL
ncbi:MAG: hypothetical protein EBU90_10800 [Proteobacteria bacterium]|nr:hypothetical protein [Pseudomonadota bacterium]